jgi:hypothetical protein
LTTATAEHTRNLQEAVQRAIDDGSLGEPRFARFVAHSPLPGLVSITANLLIDMAEVWFGGPPAQRSTRYDAAGKSVTELLKWPGGQGALVMVSSSPPTTGTSVDLMFIGSRGTLYHET